MQKELHGPYKIEKKKNKNDIGNIDISGCNPKMLNADIVFLLSGSGFFLFINDCQGKNKNI